jgi:hypothetical protein
LQCGLLRSNFSFAINQLLAPSSKSKPKKECHSEPLQR